MRNQTLLRVVTVAPLVATELLQVPLVSMVLLKEVTELLQVLRASMAVLPPVLPGTDSRSRVVMVNRKVSRVVMVNNRVVMVSSRVATVSSRAAMELLLQLPGTRLLSTNGHKD